MSNLKSIPKVVDNVSIVLTPIKEVKTVERPNEKQKNKA